MKGCGNEIGVNDVHYPFRVCRSSTIYRSNDYGHCRDACAIPIGRIQAMVPDADIQVPGLAEEPRPRDFKSREEFIKAYVSYKTEDIDEETKKKYAKKLGGLSQYKRDVKNEAAKLWKENQL